MGDDPLGFVIAMNVNRRHLSESQRAMVAARLVTTTQGERTDIGSIDTKLSPADAAEKLNISEHTVQCANAVRRGGVEELVEAVEQGDMPVSVAVKIAKESDDEQRAILAADDSKTEIKRRKRADKLRAIEGQAGALPDRKYGVVYMDPPWSWDTYSEAGKDRTPENHYQLMELDDICALEIPATDDAVVFLWVTSPHAMNAMTVLRAWGFEYNSNLVWFKDRMGTGFWARNMHEHLLIATRDNIPAPLIGTQCASVIEAAVGALALLRAKRLTAYCGKDTDWSSSWNAQFHHVG